MTEYRDVLERQLDLLNPARIPMDRLRRRRDRKRRNQRITAGIVAVAISLVAITGLVRAFSPPPETGHRTPTPTPVIEPSTMVTSFVNIRTGEETPLPASLASIPEAQNFHVSPDGTSLTFAGLRRGDVRNYPAQLYTADVDGTDVRRMTEGQDVEVSHPRWSPDGSQIVYEGTVDDGVHQSVDLFVLDVATGRSRRLTQRLSATPDLVVMSPMPSFSADGRTIIFTKADRLSVGLWTIPADGGEAVQLLDDAALGSFSPDGTRLAYRPARANGSSFSLGPEIHVARSDGTSAPPRGSGGWGTGGFALWADVSASAPTWSPDGKRILALEWSTMIGVSESTDIHLIDAKTGDERAIGRAREASWLDDDTLIVRSFHPPRPAKEPTTQPVDLSFLDIGTGEVTPLPRSITTIDEVSGIQVSPDGRSFAFEGAPSSGALHQIFVASVDGSNVRQVTFSDDFEATHPSWSPNGAQLVYEGDGVGDVAIFVLDIRTGSNTRLTQVSALSPPAYFDPTPTFNADGREILFAREGGNSFDLWTIPVEGGRVTRLVRHAAFGAFSPDSTSIAYRDALLIPGLGTGISFANVDGTLRSDGSPGGTVMGFLAFVEFESSSAMPDWSQDGRTVLYVDPFERQIYLWDAEIRRRTMVGRGTEATWLDDDTLIVRDYRSP
jgi:Tol biopolymer transport system component